jgi:hypothetical protein
LKKETCELGLKNWASMPENEKELETDASKKKRNQAVLGLTARDSVPFKLSSHSCTLSNNATN